MCSSVLAPFIKILYLYVTVVSSHNNIYVNESKSRIPRQVDNGTSCVLPLYPEFGQWSIRQTSSKLNTSQLQTGVLVPSGTILQVSCQTDYKLEGDAAVVCINSEWTSQVGQCLKKCPPLYNTKRTTVTCTQNTRRTVSCEEASDGARARFTCADFYENQGLERQPYSVCFDGKWSRNSPPDCVPICGQKAGQVTITLIIGGKNVTRGIYPWHVALYDSANKNLLCGGSLLNQRVVLTAAHCVTDEKGKLLSKDLFMLAAGKHYRNYDDPRDAAGAQFSPIYDIYIPKNYKGEIQNYFGDIAVIITKKPFVITTRVQPVCVDWAYQHPLLLDPNKTKYGYVSGWGYTAGNENPSEVLKELKVPLIRDDKCNQDLPEDFRSYKTDDKLCAGYLDSGTSVCKGDSGGGLVVQHRGRYYLVAVYSISPQTLTAEGGCYSQQYALYTKISYYTETFLLEKEERFGSGMDCEDDPNCKNVTTSESTTTAKPILTTPKSGSCTLPQHPESGQWSAFQNGRPVSNLSPGDAIANGGVLHIACRPSYKLDGNNVIECQTGQWSSGIGHCIKVCPNIISTPTTHVTCILNNGQETRNCINAVDGTLAKFRCAPFYEDPALKLHPVHLCQDGSWDQTKPRCEPVCGQKTVDATTLIVNGRNVTKGDYPWQVALYASYDKTLICGGSLLSQKVVLTAAHCVTDEDGKLNSKDLYIVAVGKYYRQFNDSRDSNEAQFSGLANVFITEQYAGPTQNYLGDIAILVTKKTFILSRRVLPVCLDKGGNFDLKNNEYGYVTGWGYTKESTDPSDVLKELKVPSVSISQCRQNLPDDFDIYLTFDKLCAGYLDNSTAVCRGDSGGGLVFKHDGRYYATGIVSLSPNSPISPIDGCDSQQYGLYTKVSTYMTFIIRKLAEFRP